MRRRAPAQEHGRDEGVQRGRLEAEEVGILGRGDKQQPLAQALQPLQLADNDVDVTLPLPAGEIAGQQLGVAERDRDRGPELMGGILQELALDISSLASPRDPGPLRSAAILRFACQTRPRTSRPAAGLRSARRPARPAPHVQPMAGKVVTSTMPEHPERRLRPPEPEAVEQGEADPDEVERDRLPRGKITMAIIRSAAEPGQAASRAGNATCDWAGAPPSSLWPDRLPSA